MDAKKRAHNDTHPADEASSSEAIDRRLVRNAERLRKVGTIESAFEQLAETCAEVGFSNVSVIDGIRRDRPYYDARGRLLSHVALGWPQEMLAAWFQNRIWRYFPDAHRCAQAMLPFESVAFPWSCSIAPSPWFDYVKASVTGMRIASATMVPVHGFGRSAMLGWSAGDATMAGRMVRQHWSPLLAYSYAFIDALRRIDEGAPQPMAELTARQRDCLTWIAQGKTVAETGILLGLSRHTVEEHLKCAAERLGVQGRSQLIVKACQLGLV